MSDPIGPRMWSAFVRLRDAKSKKHGCFGKMAVATILYAGDGGTFACHVKERVKKGTWTLHRFGLKDLGATLAVREAAEPVRWESAGAIIIDSSVGAFVPGATLKEIESSEDDAEELTDTIDEALFVEDEDEAVLETPSGKPFAVFRLLGDGNYDVVKGIDSDGAVCALAVVY